MFVLMCRCLSADTRSFTSEINGLCCQKPLYVQLSTSSRFQLVKLGKRALEGGGVQWYVNDLLCVSRCRPNRLMYTDAKEMNTIVRPNRNMVTSQICITDLTYLWLSEKGWFDVTTIIVLGCWLPFAQVLSTNPLKNWTAMPSSLFALLMSSTPIQQIKKCF